MNEWIRHVKLGKPEIKWKEGKPTSKEKIERRNQIYGCFAYCDSLEDVEKTINKVTDVKVENIAHREISGKPCFMLSYREKNVRKEHIYSTDSAKERIEKTFKNALTGIGVMMVYDYKLRRMRKDIPYLEDV